MRQLPLAEVVLDFDRYPRHEVTSHLVTEMMESCRAGVEFPPIVIDKRSRRVIDGFKRWKMHARLKLKTIAVVEKTYRSEGEMLLDAMRYNARHGQALDAFDRARCVILAGNLGIADKDLAAALSVTTEKVGALRTNKSAKAGKLTIPIKRTIGFMAGKRLNKQQVEANEKLSGMEASFSIRQLILLLETDLIDRTNGHVLKLLETLHDLIEQKILAKV